MERIPQLHELWCYNCSKSFKISGDWQEVPCSTCGSSVVEKIKSENHKVEVQDQQIISRNQS